MKKTLISTCGIILLLTSSAFAGFFGSDGMVGTWRGYGSHVQCPTGEHMIFTDLSCGTRTLSDLWNGGGGGDGPYLRNNTPDRMRCDNAQIIIDALTHSATHSLMRLKSNGEDRILLKASGEICSTSIEADAGEFNSISTKAIRQPADTEGDGPNRISGLIGSIIQGFNMDVNGGLKAVGSGTYTLLLNGVHEEIFGGTVLIDSLEISGVTLSASAYIDTVMLKRYGGSQPLGLITVDTYQSDIGYGTDGTFFTDILSSDLSRETNPGRLSLAFSIVDTLNKGVVVSDVYMKYHLE